MTQLKRTLKSKLPKPVFLFLKDVKKTLNDTRLLVAGIYFTVFQKIYKHGKVQIIVPNSLTDLKFRGRFPLNLYEREESKYLPEFLNPNGNVLELGSCLGYVSCIINSHLNNTKNHVVIEANPELIPWIEKNRALNNCDFQIENVVISKDVENTFYIHDLIVGGSEKRKTSKAVLVPGVEITDLENKYNIKFDTLVMDIEGGELSLFRNFQDDIKGFNKIFLELHPFANILTQEEADECESIMKQLEFTKVLTDGNFQIWEK